MSFFLSIVKVKKIINKSRTEIGDLNGAAGN